MTSADRSAAAASARRRSLLDGPILSTMLRLAAPTVVVLVVQTLVGIAETYFVSFLGTDALAGVVLVFPALMLMQMMSNGGVGGGVAAAVARAIGAGRRRDADALVLNALVLAILLGLVFTAAEIFGGSWLFYTLGGTGAVLAAALAYADIIFAGASLIWAVNLLAAALRGSGNTVAPAAVIFTGAVVLVPLSPALIFGWGPLPRLGIAGAGIAIIVYYLGALTALVWYLRSGRSALRLPFDLRCVEWRLMRDILRVGGLSALGTVQANLTVLLVTGAVGIAGTQAIAGFGIASRLDYVLIPLLFGLGTAAVTMVGVNIGSGQIARARRIAWLAGVLAAGFTEIVGILAALTPRLWLGLFSDDPAVLAMGAHYLRVVAPFYGFFGLGMALYFAGQGAGRVGWPVLAGTVRLVVAAVFGWFAVARWGAGLDTLFMLVAAASVAYGSIIALAQLLGSWGDEAPIMRSAAAEGREA